ncbi:MAG: hypothetical protein AB1742_06005 [bacterium]
MIFRAAKTLRYAYGFSVVELIVVLILLALLVKLFIPRFSRDVIVEKKVYGAAHTIASDIRYARTLSFSGGTSGNSGYNYWVLLSTAGSSTDTVSVLENGDTGSPLKSTTVGDDDVRIRWLDPSTNSVYFDATGTPYIEIGGVPTATGAVIEVRDPNSRYVWYVSMNRVTGAVRLVESQ